MSLHSLKNELHQQLWSAQQRWFRLQEAGATKHDLKVQGLREHGDKCHETRRIIFTGNTRVTYERVLKGFVEFCHDRGIERNQDISKREMRASMEHLMDRGLSESYLDKVRSACVKFGSLFGKNANRDGRSPKSELACKSTDRPRGRRDRRHSQGRRPDSLQPSSGSH